MNESPNWFIPLLCQVLLTDKSAQNRILAAQTLINLNPSSQVGIDALTYAALTDPDDNVRASIIQAIQSRYTSPSAPSISEQPKVQMIFNAPVYGVAGNVEGDQNINPADQNFASLLADYKQFIGSLTQKYPAQTPESAIPVILDAELKEVQTAQPQRWQNFLNLKRLWNGAKKAGLKVGEHFAENSLWEQTALAFLEGLMDKPE
jgi:hypothetical protein